MAQPVIYEFKRDWGKAITAPIILRGGTLGSVSKYTGQTRVTKLPSRRWSLQVIIPPQKEEIWRELRAFINKLDDGANYVRMFDPFSCIPRGVAAGINRSNYRAAGTEPFSDATLFSDGTGFKSGSLQARLARNHIRGETAVLIDGLVANQAQSLMVDDKIGIAGYLYQVIHSVSSDANGQALVPIRPALRVPSVASASDGIVNFEFPTSIFVMVDPPAISPGPSGTGQIGFSFEEVLP